MPLVFYDLPVYRLSADAYARERALFIARQMKEYLYEKRLLYPGTLPEDDHSAIHHPSVMGLHDHLWNKFGGMWNFNEIIGYIRLHFLGSEIRAEYASVQNERIVRSRTKQLEFKSHRLVIPNDFDDSASSTEIWDAIREQVAQCRKHLKPRYLDASIFETIGPYIDWRGLYRASLTRSQPDNAIS